IDLKQLFVGSGGALGIVTRAVVEVHPLPRQSATALLVPRAPDDVPRLIGDLETALGDFLSACEGMSRNAMACALRHRPRLRNPFQGG
ncbi:FAD-binding oxidoreductase, partial [Klebsiella pneumoniae]|uniref:FAD-binding oxidoreductase n=1 Tax=Klebsiella pneumoniae TaxID=573 RepID=UPI003852F920